MHKPRRVRPTLREIRGPRIAGMAMLAILGACGAHDGQLATEPSGSEALHFNLVPGETKTWSRDTTISGTFSVPVGSKLIIAPGVDVAFSQGGELVVRGTIEGANATLTAANPLCPKACWKGFECLAHSPPLTSTI